MSTRRTLLAALVAALLAPAAAAASPARVDNLIPISGATPFSGGCGVTGTNIPSSEAEPDAVVDPNDVRHIVASWQQDRFDTGGANSNLVATSVDRGQTWRTTRLPKLSRCTGGQPERASDPWVTIGADGRVYQASLSFSHTPNDELGVAAPTAMHDSFSIDRGFSFSDPVTLVDQEIYEDREAVTADPKRRGTAYYVWVRRYGSLGESGVEYFSRTTDGGHTWSTPLPIYTPPSGQLTIPSLIEVVPDGTLLNLFTQANGTPVAKESAPATPLVPWEVYAARSTDQGQTWSNPVHIGTIANPVAPHDPDSGATVRAYPVLSSAVAPNGDAYVSWNEILNDGASRISIARSTDGGRGWSQPSAVASPATQAFLPDVAVTSDGTVGVMWDDFRNDKRGDSALTTDVWLAHSHNGGRSWEESHLAGSFDMLTAPATASTKIAGRFVGDYQALVGLDNAFGAVFAQGKPQARQGPSDVFFARAELGARRRAKRRRKTRIHLAVRPRRVRAGSRVRFRFRATVTRRVRTKRGRIRRRRRALRRATIRFAHHKVRTNRRGRARITVRLRRHGIRRARATKRGYRRGTARVRVR